ncbi:MAG: hypothetical protein ACKPKO_55660, partial [Candidatus Fonsibacter sp.]
MRSGQISRGYLPSSYDRTPPEPEDVDDGASDWQSAISGMTRGPVTLTDEPRTSTYTSSRGPIGVSTTRAGRWG